MPVRKKVDPTEGFTETDKIAWNKAMEYVKKRLNSYSDVLEHGNTGNYIDVIKIEDFSSFMDNLKIKV
jgi:hypothetical protein